MTPAIALFLCAGVVVVGITQRLVGPEPTSGLWRWSWLLATTAVLLCAALLSVFPIQSDDIFIHLAVGRRFFATGHFPDPDPFIYSLTDYHRDWRDVWGSHLGAYLGYRVVGYSGLIILKAAVVVAGAAAPLWLARRLGVRSVLIPALLLLALWAASSRFIERASLLSDVLGAWTLAIVCAEVTRPTRWVWLLPGILLVWANLHPGVLLGLAFVGAALVARPREWRRWGLVLVASLAASCIHPQGPRMLLWATRSVLGGGLAAFKPFIAEFRPPLIPEFRSALGVKLFFALVGATGTLLVLDLRRRGRAAFFGVICFAGVLYLGLSALRFVTTASLAMAVLVAQAAPPPRRKGRRWPATALCAAMTLLVAGKVAFWGYTPANMPPRRLGLGFDAGFAPAKAADFVVGLPLLGRIYNTWGLGAFLAWHWDGKPQIFSHGYVLDPQFFVEEVMRPSFVKAAWDDLVQRYGIDAFIAPPTELLWKGWRQNLYRPEWRLVYWTDEAMVFLRVRDEYRELLARYEYRFLDPVGAKVAAGIKSEPGRVREEAARLLRESGGDSLAGQFARRLLARIGDRPGVNR